MSKPFDLRAFCESIDIDFDAYEGACHFESPSPSQVLNNQFTLTHSATNEWGMMNKLVGEEYDDLSHALLIQLFRMKFPKKGQENNDSLRVGKGAAELLIVGKDGQSATYLSLYAVGHQRDSLAAKHDAFSPLSGDEAYPFKLKVRKFDLSELKEIKDGYLLSEEQRLAFHKDAVVVSHKNEPASVIRGFFSVAEALLKSGDCYVVGEEGKATEVSLGREYVPILSRAYTITDGGRVHMKTVPFVSTTGEGGAMPAPREEDPKSLFEAFGIHSI